MITEQRWQKKKRSLIKVGCFMLYEVILLEFHEVHAIVGVVVSINGGILLYVRA